MDLYPIIMIKLFVDIIIEIDAPSTKVWDVLTSQSNTSQWATLFANGGPRLHLESDWLVDSTVLWKTDEGNVVVSGNVTAHQPHTLLRFTVFDTSMAKPAFGEEDGITFKLTEKDGKTNLHLLQGDFACIPNGNGEKYRDMSQKVWERVLPIIKALAEKVD